MNVFYLRNIHNWVSHVFLSNTAKIARTWSLFTVRETLASFYLRQNTGTRVATVSFYCMAMWKTVGLIDL